MFRVASRQGFSPLRSLVSAGLVPYTLIPETCHGLLHFLLVSGRPLWVRTHVKETPQLSECLLLQEILSIQRSRQNNTTTALWAWGRVGHRCPSCS